jgi:hypothetical protein
MYNPQMGAVTLSPMATVKSPLTASRMHGWLAARAPGAVLSGFTFCCSVETGLPG